MKLKDGDGALSIRERGGSINEGERQNVTMDPKSGKLIPTGSGETNLLDVPTWKVPDEKQRNE